MSDSIRYIALRTLQHSSYEELLAARLRAEGIDFRLRNAMTATIYPLDNMGVTLEVAEQDVTLAQQILAAMDADANKKPTDIDHSEANHADIAFEKKVYEKDQLITNAKPPYLLFLIIILMTLLGVYFLQIMR